MAQVVEEARYVELGNPPVTSSDRLPHSVNRGMGTASRPVAKAARQELVLEPGLDHLTGRLPDHPVGDRGDAEWAPPPAGLRDLHPSDRRGDVALRREQPLPERCELVLDIGIEAGDALAVDPGSPGVAPERGPSPFEVAWIGDGFQ